MRLHGLEVLPARNLETYLYVTEYSWKLKFKQGVTALFDFQCYLHPCFSTYIVICSLTCWWIVLAKLIFKSHYYGMRKPQVWEIMQLNKKNFCRLNSPVVSMSLSLPNAISQNTTLWLSKGKVPPWKWMAGQHTRMEITQADVLLILRFFFLLVSSPTPSQYRKNVCIANILPT